MTKKKFWDKIEKDYPGELQPFYAWLDEYKKSVEWERLFNFGFPYYAKQGWHNPRFDELPPAMQIGIFIQFVSEVPSRYSLELDVKVKEDFERIPELIREFFFYERDFAIQEKSEDKHG
jgi:hypothetical protein